MWKCHKCGKPVYFAERKQSLGYDWHPECLRCEECGKRLNPGQHAEHKGIPYCHVPCYGALFGPQLYGHGTKVESHTSFGKVVNKTYGKNVPRSHLESKLKLYNQFYEGKSGEIRCREVNGRLVLEGALRIYWGVSGVIHLKEDDDQRTVVTVRKRNSCRHSVYNGSDLKNENSAGNGLDKFVDDSSKSDEIEEPDDSDNVGSNLSGKSLTLPSKLHIKNIKWDELDELLKIGNSSDENEKLYQTLPCSLPSVCDIAPSYEVDSDKDLSQIGHHYLSSNNAMKSVERSFDRSQSNPEKLDNFANDELDVGSSGSDCESSGIGRNVARIRGSTAIRRRPAATHRHRRAKLKRRCSINGHFYNRETSFFTPPHGSQMSVWVTSLVSSSEVINLMLDKYKVESNHTQFALFVVRDNGEQRMLKEEEYPLMVRVMLGPHEDVAKLYIVDRKTTSEISSEVAQFLNLSIAECNAILERYSAEELSHERRIIAKYRELYKRIKQQMEKIKVRL